MLEIDGVRLVGSKTVDLPILEASYKSRYILKAEEGLTAPEVDVFIDDLPEHGGNYTGRRPRNREVVLRVGLNPGLYEGVVNLRDELYGLLTPGFKNHVKIQLMKEGEVKAEAIGWVKKLEEPLFNRETEAQITLGCNSPYFTGTSEVVYDASNVLEIFNPSTSIFSIPNAGSAPTGFELEVKFTTAYNQFVLKDEAGDTLLNIFKGAENFDVDDRLLIKTTLNEREILWWDDDALGAGGEWKNALPYLQSPATWPHLHGGNTIYTWVLQSTLSLVSWKYTPKYWGV